MSSPLLSSNPVLSVGVSVSVGGRDYLEDCVALIRNFNEFIDANKGDDVSAISRSYFGIYDGHGGSLVADFLSRRFHIELGAHTHIVSDPQRALTETWHAMDALVLAELTTIKNSKSKSAPELMDGSTCTVCLIVGDELFVANCGDSSAYTFTQSPSPAVNTQQTKGKQTQVHTQTLVPRLLTEIHGTETQSEVERVLAAGATLVDQMAAAPKPMFPTLDAVLRRYVCSCIPRPPQPKRRVNPGGLLVTRAFGDFHAKLIPRGGKPGTIIPDHGAIVKLSVSELRAAGGYLMLASDGVWDGLDVIDIQAMIQGGAGPAGNAVAASSTNTTDSGASSSSASNAGVKSKAQVAPSSQATNNTNSSSAATTSDNNNNANGVNGNGASNNKPVTRNIRNVIGKLNGVLDDSLTAAADNCVQAAVSSPYWRRAGASADNASCIIVKF